VVISPESHTAGLRVSAADITLQSALLGLRVGGAAGAIVCDAGQFSERELRHVVKDYVSSLRENVGPLTDVLAPQGDDCLAAWMNDANTAAHGQSEPAAIVGSAPDLAGVTPHAIVALIQHVLESISGLHIAIQGFGRRGRILAEVLHHAGAHIVAIADRSGGITCEYGIDIVALNHYVEEHSVLFGFPAAEAATNSDVLQCPADVLILAAAERQIGQHNAACMRSRLLIELTSGAVTRAGEKSLPTGCMFIPHLLAGAPELAVWAHEWQRGLSYSAPDPQQAATDAGAFTLHAFDRVRDMAEAQEISLRQAAVMMAVESLATSLRKR
jgi:glutamate dehydrogenase/leucine dehydrogenase